jgi:hypothetical protein
VLDSPGLPFIPFLLISLSCGRLGLCIVAKACRFLGLFPDGDSEESRGYFSLYLFTDSSSAPRNKTVTLEYSLKILNHKEGASIRKGISFFFFYYT